MQAIWSKLALPLVQITSCGQVFKIHFLHWFIYQLSLNFTTLNKTVTWKFLVYTISQGLPKWTWQVDAIISGGRFSAAQLQSHGKKSSCNNQVYMCGCAYWWLRDESLLSILLLCSFWSLNWCELQPLLINSMG